MSKTQKRIFWPGLLVGALLLATLAFVLAQPKSHAATAKDGAVANFTQGQSAPVLFRPRIRIWVHGDDVRPKVIHAWPGPVLLTAENETGADVSLVVERVLPGQANGLTARVPTLRRLKRANRELSLAVGEYLFYEAGRPNIRGSILVEPRDGQP